jgi:hypothetical protein
MVSEASAIEDHELVEMIGGRADRQLTSEIDALVRVEPGEIAAVKARLEAIRAAIKEAARNRKEAWERLCVEPTRLLREEVQERRRLDELGTFSRLNELKAAVDRSFQSKPEFSLMFANPPEVIEEWDKWKPAHDKLQAEYDAEEKRHEELGHKARLREMRCAEAASRRARDQAIKPFDLASSKLVHAQREERARLQELWKRIEQAEDVKRLRWTPWDDAEPCVVCGVK